MLLIRKKKKNYVINRVTKIWFCVLWTLTLKLLVDGSVTSLSNLIKVGVKWTTCVSKGERRQNKHIEVRASKRREERASPTSSLPIFSERTRKREDKQTSNGDSNAY